MKFSKHYFEDAVISEGTVGDLLKVGVKGVWDKIADAPKKIDDIGQFVTNDRVADVTSTPSLFNYMLNLTAADLLGWKQTTKNKGMISKFIESKKNIYIDRLVRGVIAKGKPTEEFKTSFGLSDKFLPNEISIYKTTNGGFITFASVADPYDGPPLNKTQVSKLAGKLKNMKYFISVDDKADKWFVNKTGMHYNQFLAARKNMSADAMKKDLDAIIAGYEDSKEVPKEVPKEAKPEDKNGSYKEDLTKPTWQYPLNKMKFNALARSIEKGQGITPTLGKGNFKSVTTLAPKPGIRDDGRIWRFDDGGFISIFSFGDKYRLTMNDAGKDHISNIGLLDKTKIVAL
jgi:hypothetical protein